MKRNPNIDPDTGYTPEEQLAEYNRIFGSKLKVKEVKPKVVKKIKKEKVKVDTLKEQAVKLYKQNKDAKEVAKALNISYASAYYYKKFVNEDVKKARLQAALSRI
jgi:hypothetical protein